MGTGDHDEVTRLYGPWRDRTPEDVAALFAGYSGRWWIAGGWAIDAFTGVTRRHGDIDPGIPRSDVGLLQRHLVGRFDVWAADDGTLRPIVSAQDEAPPPTCVNLWLRRSGSDPWEYDVLLTDATPSQWRYSHDNRVTLPIGEIVWYRDDIPYLRPEVQLLYKAQQVRPKDQEDFERCVPLLADVSRAWLRDALALAHPGHPWESTLQT